MLNFVYDERFFFRKFLHEIAVSSGKDPLGLTLIAQFRYHEKIEILPMFFFFFVFVFCFLFFSLLFFFLSLPYIDSKNIMKTSDGAFCETS